MKITHPAAEPNPQATRKEKPPTHGQAVAEVATDKGDETGHGQRVAETARSQAETRKQDHNRAILESSMEATLSTGNESLALLLKSAIEHVNELLEPELGPNAIQEAYDSGLDVSPEATAGRIVSMSTAFFERYHEQHPDKDLETALNDFVELIGGGIDQGFAEAREILGGLKVLEGDIATNIDKTYDLVQQGLKAFVDSYLQPAADESEA
ncbi:MAG: DUF5610 domain-containing protein [Chromatiales bacterium]|jgi:hypothetical protein|nr:DUF5610 domain-containing protein [Chromatiales bacterium]MDX9768412.1 DUF5610 domain-containing protein [Ectothiorhodospiraceae bacterium]